MIQPRRMRTRPKPAQLLCNTLSRALSLGRELVLLTLCITSRQRANFCRRHFAHVAVHLYIHIHAVEQRIQGSAFPLHNSTMTDEVKSPVKCQQGRIVMENCNFACEKFGVHEEAGVHHYLSPKCGYKLRGRLACFTVVNGVPA